MTRLQLLNAFLTERLMVAVQEILEVVGNTMSEYQEETARTKRENESLRWKLREVGFEAETTWPSAQPAALPVSGGKSLIEQQHCEQEWSSSLRQDTELTLTGEKREFTEEQRIRLREQQPGNGQMTESKILEVVGDTVAEYQEETARTKRENESLRWKLREVGFEAETTWQTGAHSAALPDSAGKSLIEQQHSLGMRMWRVSY
ncbi:hypothetical protein AAFF_G00050370 [Aldrovandia affinis]|uniref:Uncharacterized protein n=1 Tax=Aldrovandia affinis TaxID=143900 RepID=A0AAD7T4C6_9TELE|nr:hypothetical protein AAFF_G00050370 [Aldrovandia affinis]